MGKKLILVGNLVEKEYFSKELYNIQDIRTPNDLIKFIYSKEQIAFFYGLDEKSFIERFNIDIDSSEIIITNPTVFLNSIKSIPTKKILGLDTLNYTEENKQKIQNMKSGIKIISGKTKDGMITLTNEILKLFAERDRKVTRIENPIEIDIPTIQNMAKFSFAVEVLEKTAQQWSRKHSPLSYATLDTINISNDEVQNTYHIDICEKAEWLLEELVNAAENLPSPYKSFHEFYQDWTGNFLGMYSKMNDICLFIIKSSKYPFLVKDIKDKYDFNLNLSVFLERPLISEQTQIIENDINITLDVINNLTEQEFKSKAIQLKNSGEFKKLGHAQNALAVKYGFKDYNGVKKYFVKNSTSINK